MASSTSVPPNPTSVPQDELPPQLHPTPNYKNMLIEFTQRANIAMPEFQTHNAGASHAPQFRCNVFADGLVFTLPSTFFHRRAAEQEVSKVALEYLVKKIKDEGRAIISNSVTFCKGMLNEYATKLNVKLPIYNTVEYVKVFPYFVCTMDFNGTSYIGEAARRKKDAEDLAARAAILSILDKSESGIMLVQMIKAKAQLFNAVLSKTLMPTCDNLIVSPIGKTALSCELIQGYDAKDKGVVVHATNDNLNKISPVISESEPVISTPQQPEPAPEAVKSQNHSPQPNSALPIDNGSCELIQGYDAKDKGVVLPIDNGSCELIQGYDAKDKGVVVHAGNDNLNKIATVISESDPGISTPQQPEPAPEAVKSPNDSPQPDSALSIDKGLSARKRRRNNYKANKRARMEAQLKALSSPQVPPSVAH